MKYSRPYFSLDNFSTFYRTSFPVVRFTLKHWRPPLEVRQSIRDLVPLRNSVLSWELSLVSEYAETLPNVLFTRNHVGATQVMCFQWLNRESVIRANGKKLSIPYYESTIKNDHQQKVLSRPWKFFTPYFSLNFSQHMDTEYRKGKLIRKLSTSKPIQKYIKI